LIAVDTNLLVYAHRQEMPHHEAAAACVAALAGGRESWAIPWPCVHEFLATVTNPRVFKTPTPMEVALKTTDAWMSSPVLALLHEQAGHWAELRALLSRAMVRGPVVHDARIAALCLQHGVHEFWTADRDFGRFPKLRTRNPLIDS
jgi:uncharacterized protein